MPINDPIRDRKIAPESLAFDPRGTRNGSITVTYQAALTENVTNYTTIIMADLKRTRELDNMQRKAAMDGERRAKEYVGDYMACIDWDITASADMDIATWCAVPYNHEVLRSMGARFDARGIFVPPAGTRSVWYHKVVSGQEGIWWYYASLGIVFTALMAVTRFRLAFFKNNALYTIVNQFDNDYAGDGALILDAVASGGRHIPVDVDDVIEVRMFADGAAGTDNFLVPTSMVGYVTGHREKCDPTAIGPADAQNGFIFT